MASDSAAALTAAVAYSDGASRGNPGPAAYGFHIQTTDGEDVIACGEAIGSATNNVAEYRGAIAAVTKAAELGVQDLELRMDSELIVKQMKGEYRVKQPALQQLKAKLDQAAGAFRTFRVSHVRREFNKEADRLANEALDRAS
ncbi:MAG: ribonuclease HI family protein [Gemmatimonadetes bacterium]|nr:ribonuclease HI family protein [Gemmatimonadota bacterium]